MSETEKDQKLMARAFRWPKYGMAERLVARHLFTATMTNNKSQIVQNICRAAMKTEALLKEDQKIEGVDFELLRGIYAIDESLNKPQIIKFECDYYYKQGWVCKECYRVHWLFERHGDERRANYEKLIEPWFKDVNYWDQFLQTSKELRTIAKCSKCGFVLLDEPSKKVKGLIKAKQKQVQKDFGENAELFHVLLSRYEHIKTEEEIRKNPNWYAGSGEPYWLKTPVKICSVKCPSCDAVLGAKAVSVEEKEAIAWSRPWDFFFEASWYLKKSGVEQLKSSFYDWAVQVCEDASIKLSNLISPETLKDIERLMAAQQPIEETPESETVLAQG